MRLFHYLRRPAIFALLAVLCILSVGYSAAFELRWFSDRWNEQERETLASMHIGRLAPVQARGKPAETSASAVDLGRRLFSDVRFSSNGAVSCMSCHAPGKQFQDDRALGEGIGIGIRRTMPLVGAGSSAFLMWDGRKDSLWAQALGPLEDSREHGGTRLRYAHLLDEHYRNDYERIFGAMPDLRRLPPSAGPSGTEAERAAWKALGETTQRDISHVFANMGKALAAYQNTLQFGPSRLDHFIEGTLKGDPAAARLLDPQEKNGLRLFINKAQCITCHNGPLLSDGHFHNTGVRQLDPSKPDLGRAGALAHLLADEFNCLGPFSGVAPDQCDELRFLAQDDPRMLGAFKTPSLRNVAQRAPYMHAGQLPSLTDVVRHYAQAPAAVVGTSEIHPVRLSDDEVRDLTAFLRTLTGPIVETPPQN